MNPHQTDVWVKFSEAVWRVRKVDKVDVGDLL